MAPAHFPKRVRRIAIALVLVSAHLFDASAQSVGDPVENPTAKWLVEQSPQWRTTFNREVNEPFAKGLSDLNKDYLAIVENAFNKATDEGKLDESLIYRAERERIVAARTQLLGEERNLPPAIETLRVTYRKRVVALEAERIDRAKELLARYDAILAQNLVALTKAKRLDEALLIRAKREEIAATWTKGLAGLPTPPTPPPAAPVAPAVASPPPPRASLSATEASRVLVAKLLAMGATVRAPEPLKSATDLPSDDSVIQSVEFSRKRLTDQTLAVVIGLKIASVTLRSEAADKLSLEDWEQLAKSLTLRRIDLVGSIKPGVFSRLAKLQTLEEIEMSVENGSAHKDSDIAALGTLPKLYYLRLAKVPVSGAAFADWPPNSPLKTLLVPQSGDFNESNLQALITAAPDLTDLSVGTFSVSEAKIKSLQQFASLRLLRVSKSTSPADLKALQNALPKVKVLIRTDERF